MLKPFIDTGKTVNTHGVRGEVKMQPWCDDPEMFADLDTLYLDAQGEKSITLEKARVQKGMVLLKIKGVDTMDAANSMRNQILYIRREDIPMEEGEFLIQDLLGCRVIDADDGHEYGTLVDVTQTGANDVYHIRFADNKVRLCPVIPQTVLENNPLEGYIRIRPLEGLFDDEN